LELAELTMQPGRNIAMKVPAAEFAATVSFYEKTLGFRVVSLEAASVRFDHGGGHFLWIDRVEGLTKAKVWLEIHTTDLQAAEQQFKEAGVHRCDEVESLPEGMKAFWIKNPAGVVHLVTAE
jgi:catechol 2,3-dioxygenase-like lactoylglutathione lyase family enzyme